MRSASLFALLLLCLISTAAQAEDRIPLFEADYTLKRGSFIIGIMHRSLRKEDAHYIFESSAKPKGLLSLFSSYQIHEKSTWKLDEGRIISQLFSYTSGTEKKPKHSTIRFSPLQHVARGKDRGRQWITTLPHNRLAYDRANYQIALMQDMRNHRPTLNYIFLKRGKIKDYRFERLGKETIKTPMGHIDTVKLQRKADERGTTLWLAPSLDYTPVKIEQIEEDGTRYLLLLKKISRSSPQ